MNGRRQLLGVVGLGSLLAGVTAVVPDEGFAATAKPRPTSRPIPAEQRPQYKVFTVAAGDSVENVFNALARDRLGAALRPHRVHFRQMGTRRAGRGR
jgi:hypothetical protein